MNLFNHAGASRWDVYSLFNFIAYDVINGTDAALATGGSTAAARGTQLNVTLTDANLATLGVLSKVAIIKANATAAEKASIAGVLLDLVEGSVNLSTPALREQFGYKLGLDELEKIGKAIGVV